jgi:Transposase DDE domain
MAVSNVAPRRGAAQISALLKSPEITRLISDLQETRWTGRRGYPIRAMVGLALVKHVYALPTWSRTVRLVGEHAALQIALGDAPSIHAAYRFTVKLREHGSALADCLERVLAGLREVIPDLGANLAIDGSDLPAYANGMRDLPNGKPRDHYADPDASWGHRSAISTRKGGGYYGYKLHAAVCTKTDLPLAWHVATACDSEHEHMPSLLDTTIRRGFTPATCAMDKGYDGSAMYAACESPRPPPHHPAQVDGERGQRAAQTTEVPARRVDLRRIRHQAWRVEVALPDRQVRTQVGVGQGRPAAHPHPPHHRPVEGDLPHPGRR